jgi:hypothetical protein
MKKTLTTLFLGLALTITACGKDKKPTTEPAKAEPAAAEPAKADPNGNTAAAPAAPAEPAKADDKPKTGGW